MINIIPKPNQLSLNHGEFILSEGTALFCENRKLREFITEYVDRALGIALAPEAGAAEKSIRVGLDAASGMKKEGYRLKITEERIEVEAGDYSGLFYGIQSLRQLIADKKERLPCLEIIDYPGFAHRGYMLDVSRHFFDADQLRRLIDLCALMKLNVFHLHLTDDQGWRIEIKKYPELTALGSRRSETVLKGRSDNTPVSGFYTQDEIRDIVAYARERSVTVIPEIDMPGHVQAILACYPEFGCDAGGLNVATEFGITTDILCAGNEKVYEFLAEVLDEICDVFGGDLIHLGGDEAPKTRWENCPKCREKIREAGLDDEEQLQGYFTNRMIEYLREKGKRAIVWNESLNAGNLDESAVCQQWMDRKNEKVTKAVNEGRKTIVSDFFHYYLDYPYGMTPLRKTYNYNPVFKNVEPDMRENIIGVEAPLWTELVSDVGRLDYQTFPRLAALAETGWTKTEMKDYRSFLGRLEVLKKLLQEYGVNYARDVDVSGPRRLAQTLKHFGTVLSAKDFLSSIKMMRTSRKKKQ